MWLGAPFFKREKNVPQRQSGMRGARITAPGKGPAATRPALPGVS